MPPAAGERSQTNALDRAAIGTGLEMIYEGLNNTASATSINYNR
jgi:hypothetical protein